MNYDMLLCTGSDQPVVDKKCPVCHKWQGIRIYVLPHYHEDNDELWPESIRLLTDSCPTYLDCCGGPEWRGHVCPYHEGWIDGYEEGHGDGYQDGYNDG